MSFKTCAGPTQRPVRAGPCCPAGTLTARMAAAFSLSTAAAEATGITLSRRSTACLSAGASVSHGGRRHTPPPPPPSSNFYWESFSPGVPLLSRLLTFYSLTHLSCVCACVCVSVRRICVFALKARLHPSCNSLRITAAASLIVSLFPLLLPSAPQSFW